MRMLPTLAIAFLLLPMPAVAQTAELPPPTSGWIDLGARVTSVSGDAARYERYRDLGDGLFVDAVRAKKTHHGWFLTGLADHVGRRDQRFAGSAEKPGKLTVYALWDQIPLLFSRTTRTLFTEDLSRPQPVLTIADAIQQQAQASAAAMPALFAGSAVPFTLRTERKIARAGFSFLATPDLTVRSNLQHTDRDGAIPYGGSFGHSSLVEFPAPVQHSLTDFDGGAEWTHDRLLLRAGYAGSWFRNDFTTATFDNPFRVTDSAATPSRGRVSLAPSSSFISVNGLASVRLPRRSRITAYVSSGTLDDDGATLMPATINSATSPSPLERTALEGKARTSAMNLNFVTRPVRYMDLDVRVRSYDYDNQTPPFTLRERIAFDNTPASLGAAPVESEPFGVERRSVDADLRFTPVGRSAFGVGFTHSTEERTHRIFESTADNGVRLTFDSVGNQWFSLRTRYEHLEKRGHGFEAAALAEAGDQPGLRHFDVASRDRDRVTILGLVTPASNLTLNGSLAAGKDDFLESEFGLRDNTHRVYSAGFDATPTAALIVGGSYSFERYNALSRSRQANSAAEFADPSRNWASDGTDRVHSFILNAALSRIAGRIDLAASYDFNRARTTYEYLTGPVPNRTLPEEAVVDTTLPTPTALPLVRSDLQRGTADALFAVTRRVGLGLSYWHERYRVSDFTLDAESTPNLARGQALLLGYLYRPYTANTVWARMVLRW
jgi:MtrB/PioB family decaheme-associated outer membrane protein